MPIEATSKPVKIGGLKAPSSVPDDFNTMFEKEIEALFTGIPVASRKRK
jgi:hypothetical protein